MNTINAIKFGKVVNLSINGKLYTKKFDTNEEANDFYLEILSIKKNPTDENIDSLIISINKNKRIAYLNNFEIDTNTNEIFLAGFNTPIPQTMIDIIEDYNKNNYPLEPIINFWKLLMINPDKRVRNSIFDFIKNHDFSITDFGYLIAYKAVYRQNDTKDKLNLDEFVTNMFLKVKNNWKCSPNKYVVYKNLNDNVLGITKKRTINFWNLKEKNLKIIGNLADLFNNIIKTKNNTNQNASKYTDMYSKTMTIELGVPVKVPRESCDADPQKSCSTGLHVGATKYVESYADENSVILVCLVNPMNIVAVPDNESSKMRVCEYYPFALATFNNNKIEIIEQKYFEFDYRNYELTDLETMAEKTIANEQPIKNAIHSELDDRSLSELTTVIQSRIYDIYDAMGY